MEPANPAEGTSTQPPEASPGTALDLNRPRAGAVDWIVNVTIAQATTRTERRFAWLRIGFCLLSLSVFLLHALRYPGDVHLRQVALELLIAALGLCVSVWVLRSTRQRLIGESLKVTSAALDAALVSVALAGNQLGPDGTYLGLLASLDVAIAPLTILTSVLRVSPRAVVTSSTIITLSVASLLAVDALRGLAVAPKLPLYAIYHAMAVLLAHFLTARAREIFRRVGDVAVRAEGARRSVRGLLEDHHDLRSVLCNLQLSADRLHEALERGAESSRLLSLEGSLSSSIAALTRGAETTRNRALLALEGADQPTSADVSAAVEQALNEARSIVPDLAIRVEASAAPTPVLFGGGTAGLARLLLHLFVNAKEGDGQRGAANVRLSTQLRRGAVEIEVRDDGPGFAPGLLDKLGRDRGYTTKTGSSGIGLWLTHSSLLAAGGALSLTNDHGACVRVVLRPAP
jgi:signal transduction histidine kinase